MPGQKLDGHDFFAVHEAAGQAIERARRGDGPSLLHLELGRFFGHFEGDGQTYRAPREAERLRADRDCLKLFRQRVTQEGLLHDHQLDGLESQVKQLIDEAVDEAESAPMPDKEDLLTDVYVSY